MSAVNASSGRVSVWRSLVRSPSVLVGAAILLCVLFIGLAAPFLHTMSPDEINPSVRNKLPGYESTLRDDEGNKIQFVHLMGTDSLGRDIYSRVVFGARVSLLIGATVAVMSALVGLVLGLLAGYFRWLDAIVMRVMDGLMAIPAILLALSMVALLNAGQAGTLSGVIGARRALRRSRDFSGDANTCVAGSAYPAQYDCSADCANHLYRCARHFG